MFKKVLIVLASLALASANLKDRAYYEEKFFEWLQAHNVEVPSGAHFVKMLQNFANNDDLIETHNAGNHSYTLGHNQFSHMSVEEWKEFVGIGLQRPDQEPAPFVHEAPSDLSTLASEIDWTTKGAVTGVKDQGQCGSCWSFSATGALEGAYYNKYHTLKSFSEQNLVDCDTYDHACNGGWMDNAFKWIKQNGGLCHEDQYPYTAKKGSCNSSKNNQKDTNAKVSSWTDVTANSDSALMSALNKQPVSVAIEADQAAFQLYKSGVFTASCGTKLDHGVLAVGYGTDKSSGLDFYKVKNSWGTGWGEGGYIRLQRGVSQKQGQCGILSGPPSYPNL